MKIPLNPAEKIAYFKEQAISFIEATRPKTVSPMETTKQAKKLAELAVAVELNARQRNALRPVFQTLSDLHNNRVKGWRPDKNDYHKTFDQMIERVQNLPLTYEQSLAEKASKGGEPLNPIAMEDTFSKTRSILTKPLTYKYGSYDHRIADLLVGLEGGAPKNSEGIRWEYLGNTGMDYSLMKGATDRRKIIDAGATHFYLVTQMNVIVTEAYEARNARAKKEWDRVQAELSQKQQTGKGLNLKTANKLTKPEAYEPLLDEEYIDDVLKALFARSGRQYANLLAAHDPCYFSIRGCPYIFFPIVPLSMTHVVVTSVTAGEQPIRAPTIDQVRANKARFDEEWQNHPDRIKMQAKKDELNRTIHLPEHLADLQGADKKAAVVHNKAVGEKISRIDKVLDQAKAQLRTNLGNIILFQQQKDELTKSLIDEDTLEMLQGKERAKAITRNTQTRIKIANLEKQIAQLGAKLKTDAGKKLLEPRTEPELTPHQQEQQRQHAEFEKRQAARIAAAVKKHIPEKENPNLLPREIPDQRAVLQAKLAQLNNSGRFRMKPKKK